LWLADSRGQSVPIDLVFGTFIFLAILSYFFITWDSYAERYRGESSKGGSELSAIVLADLLASSQGLPENWSDYALGVQAVGLASRPGVLDWGRITALSSMPYGNAKVALGLEKDFYIKIESPSGLRYASIGLPPANASSRAVEVMRIALLNGNTAYLKVQIYGD